MSRKRRGGFGGGSAAAVHARVATMALLLSISVLGDSSNPKCPKSTPTFDDSDESMTPFWSYDDYPSWIRCRG